MTTKVLVTGAAGQLGSELIKKLVERHGLDHVIATDIRAGINGDIPIYKLDCLIKDDMESIVRQHKINHIYHLAAILSAAGEQNPLRTWDINMTCLLNVLEVGRKANSVSQIFYPSSIAAFGTETPRCFTPQQTIMHPSTVYGISKLTGEHWCQYYFDQYGLDIRSVRYPGIIGHGAEPGGGTTDYAVAIYHAAVQGLKYTSYLNQNTRLPMIYMEDAITATLRIMEAKKDNIKVRTSYNISGMNFTPAEIYQSIRNEGLDFEIEYKPDYRQKIADSWTESIDDSVAKNDWNWEAKFNLKNMTKEMVHHLRLHYAIS